MGYVMIFRIAAAIAVGAGLLVPSLGFADDRSDQAIRWMTLKLAEFGYAASKDDLTKDDARKRLMVVFTNADVDGNGVSQKDYDFAERRGTAQNRANLISQILRNDLDGDGRVTRAEVEASHAQEANRPLFSAGISVDPTPEQRALILKQVIEREMKADKDGDGVITWAEMLAYANENSKRTTSYTPPQAVPLFLDANGDGTVSKAEFTALIDRAFDAADTNHDGKLSQEERAALLAKSSDLRRAEMEADRVRREQRQAQSLIAKCGLPKINADAKVVLVGVYEGQGLSTVALGGDDASATVARVTVEDGSSPVALVLASYSPMVWLIDGNVRRVSQVIASADSDALQAGDLKTPRVGVVGVPRDRVTVAASVDCLHRPSSPRDGTLSEADAQRFAVMTGRRADVFVGAYDLARVSIPSGTIDKDTPLPGAISPKGNGPSAEVWPILLRFNPKGLIDIDPAKVVARAKPTRYAVMPAEAGLIQLIENGSLEITGYATEIQVGNTTVQMGGGDDGVRGATAGGLQTRRVANGFLIKRQITFPAGLNGAHSVKFVLPKGVPEPLGSPGHSEVIREAS
jgi:hypothetical protein